MTPWLSDLSEDWVSQPVSASPSVVSNASGVHSHRPVPPHFRSRLPRPCDLTGRSPDAKARPVARNHGSGKPMKNALLERSLSDNHLPDPALSASVVPDAMRPRPASRSLSAVSADSVIHYATVERNICNRDAQGDIKTQTTPEWKRRLLKGEVGYGGQPDLFSPMGLECIFQKPSGTLPGRLKSSNKRLQLRIGLDAIPSSPPPWPLRRSKDGTTDVPLAQDQSGPIDSSNPFRSIERHNTPLDGQYRTSLDHGGTVAGASRTVSGQLELENECFSPVVISASNTVGKCHEGSGGFCEKTATADALPPLGTSVNRCEGGEPLSIIAPEDSTFSRFPEDSLPEDLPAGTPDVVDIGGFVCTKRGGYSADGSFRQRPLSPSPKSRLRPSDSVAASNALGRGQTRDTHRRPSCPPSPAPETPHQCSQEKSDHQRKKSLSNSPLKLFDTHDTFTSRRLQRRLSQLGHLPKNGRLVSSPTPDVSPKISADSSPASRQETSQSGSASRCKNPQVSAGFRRGTFGMGGLDRYQFQEKFSSDSSSIAPGKHFALSSVAGSPTAASPICRSRNYLEDDRGLLRPPKQRETAKSDLKKTQRGGLTAVRSLESDDRNSGPQADAGQQSGCSVNHGECKRGPTAPFKDPTPKRRRTLHSLNVTKRNVAMQPTTRLRDATQSTVEDQSIDDHRDDPSQLAESDVLARRRILRPRNPTPSQRRRDDIRAEILEATEAFMLSSPQLDVIQEHMTSPPATGAISQNVHATAVANQVAAFSLQRAKIAQDQCRKRSVTTQDFLDEAVKIMEFIRTKGRPTTGLDNVAETETAPSDVHERDGSLSTPLTFSRCPSRDGADQGWRKPNQHELDPRVMSHLQRFQEKDSDEFMPSSIRSLRFAQLQRPMVTDNRRTVQQDDIRITEVACHSSPVVGRVWSSQSRRLDPQSSGSNPSTGSSLGKTEGTNASRKSDLVATLPPSAVAHLISDQVAGMNFDHEKGMWVKQRAPSRAHPPGNTGAANETEDDPLGNIPDLTVDEVRELVTQDGPPCGPVSLTGMPPRMLAGAASRSVAREGRAGFPTESSSVPSNSSNFAWSESRTETRTSLYGDQAQRPASQGTQQGPRRRAQERDSSVDVEREFTTDATRATEAQPSQAGDLTISLSSPPVQRDEEPRRQKSKRSGIGKSTGNPALHLRSMCTEASWPHGPKGKTLLPSQAAPMVQTGKLPDFEEIPRNYRMQMSMSLTGAVLDRPQNENAVLAPSSSPCKIGDVNFMLSDLSEFTLNQVDEREPANRVVIHHEPVCSRATEDRFALGTAKLVEALQDAESDEPYWDDLRKIDLRGKALPNLHRLDDICCRLEELDVAENNISQVTGVPATVRRLKIQQNHLTSITSWSYLLNLQHLDVSSNDIDNLSGLSRLLHLRTLKADDNHIESLDGLWNLDGLVELSVQRNAIKRVDFEAADLKCLIDLNLKGNGLMEICHLDCLPRLQCLNLDDNRIESLEAKRCPCLQHLRLCYNAIGVIAVDQFPQLEVLCIDGNPLLEVRGLANLRHLRALSAREQSTDASSLTTVDTAGLLLNCELQSFRLSGSATPTLRFSQDVLNLQRLELASMGLASLPPTFGQLAPNIRSLNLNFNALKDLRPLLNIRRIDQLLLAGNRLARLRKSSTVLAKLVTLKELDLRDNPLTIGFYAPVIEQRITKYVDGYDLDAESDRFTLPPGSLESDSQHQARLDDDTKLRRRVHEMVLASTCRKLQVLDGLDFDPQSSLRKDATWERLLRLGVVRRPRRAGGTARDEDIMSTGQDEGA